MLLYFSGVADRVTAELLHSAGVQAALADPNDAALIAGFRRRALDSGAYRAFKSNRPYNLAAYLDLVANQGASYDFCIGPDVLGDADATWQRWWALSAAERAGLTPVWPWGGPREHLAAYLATHERIAIGALVPLMRAKDEKMLADLLALARAYPGRLHILGANWLRALAELAPYALSADTSKFLDAGRYGHVIFTHTRTGRLSQAPARVIPAYAGLDRAARIVESARNLAAFCAI